MRGVSGVGGLLHIINIYKSECFSAESSPAVDALHHMTGGGATFCCHVWHHAIH